MKYKALLSLPVISMGVEEYGYDPAELLYLMPDAGKLVEEK